MLTEAEILSRTLHRLEIEDIRVVRQLADTLFVRLVQPFHQVRVAREFDFKATLRAAMRTGHLTPTYVRREKTHLKSQLVIAMSMSGIDRCFAVGLIPLLSQLRRYLDFRLYIYTDDMVEAEFSGDGFIANDSDIAWNNVLGPVVFARLADLQLDSQETKLLLIDSLGGGDSQWFSSVGASTLQKVRTAQTAFMGQFNPWQEVRDFLAGDYSKFNEVPRHLMPLNWQDKLARNTSKRWVETPALREYLIHYIFNPRYGKKLHAGYYPKQYERDFSVNVRTLMGAVREKFKDIHVLTPSFSDESREVLDQMKRRNFVDFHHRADSLEGFAQVLINIVYNRDTDRLTTPVIRFANYVESVEGDAEAVSGHSELMRTMRDCFANCDPQLRMPPTVHIFQQRKRGKDYLEDVAVEYRDIGAGEFWLWDRPVKIMEDYDWRIDPMWAHYGKVRKAEYIINFIKQNEVLCLDGRLEVCQRMRKPPKWEGVLGSVTYDKHRTRALTRHVEDSMSLFSEQYWDFFHSLPLRHAVWCTLGKFRHDCLAISASPADEPDKQRATVFHEHAHWAEHAAPPIGVYTNTLLQHLTGEFRMKALVPVGIGEYAAPVRPEFTPWIKDYAGKWYRRHEKSLPNPTEVFSVHAEYFRSAEALVELLEHDMKMVKRIAFIYMGGPIAMLQEMIEVQRRKSLEEIEQKDRKSHSYESRGSKKDASKDAPKYTQSVKPDSPKPSLEERRSFGI